MTKPKGWRFEPDRHAMASRGIKTKFETKAKGKGKKSTSKSYGRSEEEGFETVEEINVSKQNLWKVYKYNDHQKSYGGTSQYSVILYPQKGSFEEDVEGDVKLHQTEGRYPDDLHPKPKHLSIDLFLSKDFRGSYMERIWESEHEFEEYADHQGIKEGTDKYQEEKEYWLEEVEQEIKGEFYDSLKDEIKVRMWDFEENEDYYKKIDVEYKEK